MFCPKCKAEYRIGFIRCSDCDIELVDHLPVDALLDTSVEHMSRGFQTDRIGLVTIRIQFPAWQISCGNHIVVSR